MRGQWIRVLEELSAFLISGESERTRRRAQVSVLLGPAAPYSTLMREKAARFLKERADLRAELGL